MSRKIFRIEFYERCREDVSGLIVSMRRKDIIFCADMPNQSLVTNQLCMLVMPLLLPDQIGAMRHRLHLQCAPKEEGISEQGHFTLRPL